MYFVSKFAALAAVAAALVGANTVTFLNQDDTTRTVIFTPSIGNAAIASIKIAGHGSAVQSFPDSWIGNWFSVSGNNAVVPGMLGEVTFGGAYGITYFDVSAIVNPNDHDGVKEIYPAVSKAPVSGCAVFPCNTAYYLPDDVQTRTTTEKDLICTLGGSGTQKRDEFVARKFVLGQS